MKQSLFKFSKINHIEELDFDQSLDQFYKYGVEGTIRENLQNSLDAKRQDSNNPVKVDIKLENVKKNDLPGIDTIFTHINSLEGKNEYSKAKIAEMKRKELMDDIPTLIIADSNTKGLAGAENGKSERMSDTFGIYAYEKGSHAVSDDLSHEATRGGSHGVGKIANNAISEINLSYFSNHDALGQQHVGGTIHLIDHEIDNQAFRKTGYFTDERQEGDKNKFYPYENQNFSTLFNKEERGLKNIIPYVDVDLKVVGKRIVKGVCDNFFLAILRNQLVVSISIYSKKMTIDRNTIQEVIKDNKYYPQDYSEMKEEFTPLYIDTYLNQKPEKIVVESIDDSYQFDLYFTYNQEILRGRVGLVRGFGMKITDHKVRSNIKKPFNAVLIGGEKEDEYLKSLENEAHTEISAAGITNKQDKRNATRFINNLDKTLASLISEFFEKNNPSDGQIDTSDLVYETTIIRKSLEDTTEPVRTNLKDELAKAKGPEREKRGKDNPPTNKPQKTGRRTRTPKKTHKSGGHGEKRRVNVHYRDLERVALSNYEIINIHLDENFSYKNCNLQMIVIDGEGKTVKKRDNIHLIDNFTKIVDFKTSEVYQFNASEIKNVKIIDQKISLKLFFKEDYNHRLKYSYILEVDNK